MTEPLHPEHPDLFKKLSKALDQEEDFLHLSYRLGFEPKRKGMLLWTYQDGKAITRFEQFGIHALGLHHHGLPHSELDPSHRRFVQNLLRFAVVNSSEGYFFIPQKHVAFFLGKLGRFPEVRFQVSGAPVMVFSEHPLVPIVHLVEQTAQKVVLTASFQDGETEKFYNFSDSRIFSGHRSWAVIGPQVFSIKSSPLTSLLEDFDSEGNLTLFGHEAADFIQNYLPLLSRKPEVVLPENFFVPHVLQEKPEAHYKLYEEEGSDKLVLNLNFSYGSRVVTPHLHEEDVLVEFEEEGKKILVRRDMDFEREALEGFYEQGFKRISADRFETGGEEALDFISAGLPSLQKIGKVDMEEDLASFRLMGTLGEGQIKAKAVQNSIDWLDLQLYFEIEGVQIPYETVQALVAQQKRYIKIPQKGFVKIDLEDFAHLEEKISELEAEVDENGVLRVSQFHSAYLDETFQVDWGASQDLGAMARSLRITDRIPETALPENLKSVLREYQHRGYDWLSFLHDHRFHGILADDMGLGKTLQSLCYLLDRRERFGPKPNLVLAPTSVVFNWANEAKKFTPQLKVVVLTGPSRAELYPQMEQADLVITSYAIYRRDVEILSQQDWRTVILDEAQNIKNFRSKTALLVKEIKSEQRWALTGTPLENRLSELWSIFDFLMPGFLGSYPHFKRKYQQPIENQQSVIHLERLKKRIYPFILRRLKNEVAKELPPKTEVTSLCEMTPEQTKLYQEVLATCRKQVFAEVEKKGIEKSHVSILTALLRLRQVCCHPELLGPQFEKRKADSGKMDAFKDLVTEVIDEGHRILVFSQFVEMLSLLRSWLESQQIAYEYLDGRTRKREEKVTRFNENPDIPVFLVSLRAGGTGLNLTGADYVIHYDPWWNPAVQDQATDRVHRIGQKKHVFSYKLITKDSVEEKILLLQEKKRSLARELLSSDAGIGKRLTYEDLEYLFT